MALIDCVADEHALPTVEVNEDCGPEVHASEVEELFIAQATADAFTDVTDPSEWATRLDQSVTTTGDEIRRLVGSGDKPAATGVIVNVSKRRKKKIDAAHQLNFTLDDLTQANYDASLIFQVGVYKRIWYKTRGGNIFGGDAGVLAFVEANPILGGGDEVEKVVFNISWNSLTDPARDTSPI